MGTIRFTVRSLLVPKTFVSALPIAVKGKSNLFLAMSLCLFAVERCPKFGVHNRF
jgi:hypothetical protein